jgi:hypothetical protein
MKASILVRDLVKLIAKHGDLDVGLCINGKDFGDFYAELKCVDELRGATDEVISYEIYGEER